MVSDKNIHFSQDDFELFLKNIGKKLKTYRLAKGYSSYEQFAFARGIARAQYGKYEKGTEDMRISSLYKVLQLMDITWEEFFAEVESLESDETVE